MSSRQGLFSSSVGTKIVVGLTGCLLVGYLLIHIAGNLLVFFGPAVFNRYAYVMEANPLLPAIEILLLLTFLMHVYKTVRMCPAWHARTRTGIACSSCVRSPARW